MNKIAEIFKSWVTSINPSPEEQAIAQYRANVCDSCDRKEYVKAINSFICSSCGCPLSRKVFSPKPGPEACPLSKWEK
jgi:ribosomal protein L37E